MRPPARPGFPAAAFAAALVLCAQAGSLVHVALAAHARCEHGQFIEVDDDDVLPPSTEPRDSGLSAADDEVAVRGHRHCLAQDEAGRPATLRTSPLLIVAPDADDASAPEQRTAAAGRERYRLVPKQSPPA